MQIPKFLIADNSAHPEQIFIVHTEYPRFLLDISTEEIEWLDDLEEESDVELESEIAELINLAYDFFDEEMSGLEED